MATRSTRGTAADPAPDSSAAPADDAPAKATRAQRSNARAAAGSRSRPSGPPPASPTSGRSGNADSDASDSHPATAQQPAAGGDGAPSNTRTITSGVPVATPTTVTPPVASVSVTSVRGTRSVGSVSRDVVDKFGLVFYLVSVIFFAVLAIHVLLVVGNANPHNSLTSDFASWADDLVGAFKTLFTNHSNKTQTFYNYGLAAVVYLAVGALVRRICRRIAGS